MVTGPLALVATAAALLLTVACNGAAGPARTPTAVATPAGIPVNVGKGDSAQLTGAGSTFAAPVYQAWADDYHDLVAKGVRINYQSIGSGGGIQQFTEGTVDFGATDAPMTDAELAKAPDAQHLPMVMGAVVLTYSLEGLKAPLRFDGPTLAKIYLGQVTKWNDPAIVAINPGVKLPNSKIQVVHRSDGSGTSFVFTDWLSKVSPEWKAKIGVSKNPNWPAGQGGKGNEGVTSAVKQTPNALGYVELNYALANKLPFADVQNRAGHFVTPGSASTAAAAEGVAIPEDYRVSITNSEGADAYPIAAFTFMLVHRDAKSCSAQKPLVDFLWWALHAQDATAAADELNYTPVPASVATRLERTLLSLTCQGKAVLAP
ncbi:MAG: phosphate ABC transporter substrate-binding protein PstS [Dehalococcoidia bacterium]|nr:phosphate ABC transporter substrate-binding protein PstS [Dehalococcoidia bacterium]